MLLFEGIQLKGYQGAYDSVQRLVKGWKGQSVSSINQDYVPLVFAPGEACQFDWSHEQVLLSGVNVKIKLAHFRLCHSRKPYLRAYPRETQEMGFDAHVRAFEFYGGVPHKMIYDNPKTIVDAIYQGKRRQFNRPIRESDESLSGGAGGLYPRGWVGERSGGTSGRYHALSVVCSQYAIDRYGRTQSLAGDALHSDGWKSLILWTRRVTIEPVFSEEQRTGRPAMACFDGYYERLCPVQRTSVINYDRNQYSVPNSYVGKAVSVRAYAERIMIVADDQVIATHTRCFGRCQTIFDPWHYIPILKVKPGALRNGAPFADWDLPASLKQLKAAWLEREGGDREFVQLLLLIQDYGIESVTVACERAIEADTTQLSVITNLIHRLVEPPSTRATRMMDAPMITTPPWPMWAAMINCVTGRGLMLELSDSLKDLKLYGMVERLPQLLDTPRNKPGFTEGLKPLIEAEKADRNIRRLRYQMKIAKFPHHRDLQRFDFKQSQVDQPRITDLSRSDFMDQAHNLIFVGGTGTGKTPFGHRAGYPCHPSR